MADQQEHNYDYLEKQLQEQTYTNKKGKKVEPGGLSDLPEGQSGIVIPPFSLKKVATLLTGVIGIDLSEYTTADGDDDLFSNLLDLLKNIEITSKEALDPQATEDAKNQGLKLIQLADNAGYELTFVVAYTDEWVIIEDVVKVKNFFVAFTYTAGRLSAELNSGVITFMDAELALQVALRVPSFLLMAELQQAVEEVQPPPPGEAATKLVDKYLRDLKNRDSPPLEVVNIRLLAALRLNTFSLHLAVKNLLDAGPLHVAAFQADIDFSAGGTTEYAITAAADILFELPESILFLTVVARRQSSAGNSSWAFAGSITQPVLFGELIKGISKPFLGEDTEFPFAIPDILADIEIDYLGLAFESGSSAGETHKSFDFEIFLRIPLGSRELDASISASYKTSTGGDSSNYELSLSGAVFIEGHEFAMDFKRASEGQQQSISVLEINYESDDTTIELKKLIQSLADDNAFVDALPEVNVKLDGGLHFALIREQSATPAKQNGNASANTEAKDRPVNKYLFGLELNTTFAIDFSELPVVGSMLPGDQGASVEDFTLYLASHPFYQEEIDLLTVDIPGADLPSAAEDHQGVSRRLIFTKGPNFRVKLKLGSYTRVIPQPPAAALPGAQPSNTTAPTDPAAQPAEGTASAGGENQQGGQRTRKKNRTSSLTASRAQWLELDKTLGPVTLERIGVSFVNGRIWFYLSASLSMGPMTIGLDGLGIGAPINDPTDISASLMGMSVHYKQGNLEIGGAFLQGPPGMKVGDDEVKAFYAGELMVRVLPTIEMFVMGMYAHCQKPDNQDYRAFFVFGMLGAPLGGPPAFFVTGLAAGFGYNTKLNLPPIEKVSEYLLVKAALPPPTGQSNPLGDDPEPESALGTLMEGGAAAPVAISEGDIWIAVGLRFTSFQLVNSFALLTVSFGNQLQIGLLGRSQVSMPPKAPKPLSFVEVNIKAVLTPEASKPTPVFSLEAGIAPGSYILDPDCRLQGGLAFYFWSDGDFVISLGGYHPHLQVPAHYPAVQRAGLNWQLTSELFIKGTLYFAATPAAMMAGGRLEAAYHSERIQASFIAQADFLMNWEPFHYDLELRIAIHIRADLYVSTFTGIANVNLHLWGPEFSGIASIEVGPVSFEIEFGGSKEEPKPLVWNDFRKKFLPKNTSDDGGKEKGLLRTSVTKGTLKKDTGQGVVLDPQHFELSIQCAVPVTKQSLNGESATKVGSQNLGIIPMMARYVTSTLSVELKKSDKAEYKPWGLLNIQHDHSAGPKSLWANSGSLSQAELLSSETQVENLITGMVISPKVPEPDKTRDIPISSLQYDLDEELSYTDFMVASTLAGTTRPDSVQAALSTLDTDRGTNTYQSLSQALEALLPQAATAEVSPSAQALPRFTESPIFHD